MKNAFLVFILSLGMAVAADQGPSLKWIPQTDWINLKASPRSLPQKTSEPKPVGVQAVGDGIADDTLAIQAALDAMNSCETLYFPPGVYRITSTLVIGDKAKRAITLIGHGSGTTLLWDGPEGGSMYLQETGYALSQFIGLTWNGQGKAGVGLDISSLKGFETEQRHLHCTYLGFREAGIRLGKNRKVATAETLYENCLFINCGTGVSINGFNYYDHTFIGCEFRSCDTGIYGGKGVNFYVRECLFVGSREMDVFFAGEHGASLRRCISKDSNLFATLSTSVASFTIQDCRVEGWQNREGAIVMGGGAAPVLIFDTVFCNPIDPEAIAIISRSKNKRVILSNNKIVGGKNLTQEGRCGMVYEIPPSRKGGALESTRQTFFRQTVEVPGKIFDARRDFGAKGDGKTDDTVAVQATINAAKKAGKGSQAYFPMGRYVVTSTLKLSGADYSVAGSGFGSALVWMGPADGVTLEVGDPVRLKLENIVVGRHDYKSNDARFDILQKPSNRPSLMCYDRVWVYGMYKKEPQRRGLGFENLGENDTVYIKELNGNIRINDSADATIFCGTTYEGTLTVEGKSTRRRGFVGGAVRLATVCDPGLWIKDNQSVVFSDFYVEQAEQFMLLEGDDSLPAGRVTLSGAKFEISNKAEKTAVHVNGYQGDLILGTYQYYPAGKAHIFTRSGASPFSVTLWGGAFYDAGVKYQLGEGAVTHGLANSWTGQNLSKKTPDSDDTPGAETTRLIQSGLDDFRQLGEIELRLVGAGL